MSKFIFNLDGSLLSSARPLAASDGRGGQRAASVASVSYDEYLRAQQDVNLLTSRVSSFQIKVLDIQNDINQIKALTAAGQVFPGNTLANAEKALSRANADLETANADLAKARSVISAFENSQTPVNNQTPTAQTFEVIGPPGATVEQAREIFNRQRTSGSLVGLAPGDVVSAGTQAAAGLSSALSQVRSLPNTTADSLTAGLRNISISNPVSLSDFAKQTTPNFSLGPLNPQDVQGLMAQTAATVKQSADQVSAAKGVGKFGLNINQLESTGFVKPGTAQSFARAPAPSVTQKDIEEATKINAEGGDITPEQVARNRQLNSFLTPSVFTGKLGVANLGGVLRSENIQNNIQGDVLKQSYNSLVNSGVIQNLRGNASQIAATVQTAAEFGVKTAENLVNGRLTENFSAVASVAKAAEYAKNFATGLVNDAFGKVAGLFSRGGSIYAGVTRPQGVKNTVNRSTVNSSVTNILGNAKIPTPTFVPRASAGSTADDTRLTYTGNDPIVWDRVNAARLRDGLPGLDEIGLPRPR